MVAEGDPAGWAARSLFRFLRRSGPLVSGRGVRPWLPDPEGAAADPQQLKKLTLHVLLGFPALSAALRLGFGYRLQLSPRPASQDVLRTHPGPDEAGEYNPSPEAAALIRLDWVFQDV